MANEEHLKILKQGVEAWNAWRKEKHNRTATWSSRDGWSGYDLSGADLRGADLSAADFSGTAIGRAANLSDSNLRSARLINADLSDANVSDANLSGARLDSANFSRAYLKRANLRGAILYGADLRGADLGGANLAGAFLRAVDFGGSRFAETVLSGSDLRVAKGLESIKHDGPSILGSDVIQSSQGQLPVIFLKGCGLSDWEIEAVKLHNSELTEDERTAITYEILRIQGQQPIQLHPLFISYSSADAPFVEALEPKFDKLGIRYWRDVHDLKAGRLETQIDRAIRLNPTVLLVLSEKSVGSDWVEWEVGQARKLEKELKRDVLCPVALDDTWKTCSWPGPLRRQIEDYHILDFSAWEDESSFEGQFGKLLEGLKLFYRGEGRDD